MNKIVFTFYRLFLIMVLVTGAVSYASAQEKIVTGRVTSSQDGAGLPGVNVIAKGTLKGTSTDKDGNYKIGLSNAENVLVFSFLGFETGEISINSRAVVDVKLVESASQLSEVVVTALGFKEEADKLALTSSKVDGKSLVKSGETGIINGLAGKAAGVQINRSAGDPGAGAFIQIRGLSTITGNNQPLIVVDGIPVSNSIQGAGYSTVLQQSRLNDINPDDIASLQILKGASAAALWGSRAANGVIIITTKSGNKDKLSVSYTSTVSIDEVNVPYHPRQTTYGQGTNGLYSSTETYSWGDRIADRSGAEDTYNTSGAYFKGASGKLYYPITAKNSRQTYTDENYNRVFGNGHSWDNSINFSGGNEKSTFYFGIGDLRQQGLFKGNSDYNRTSFKLNTDRKLSDILRISTNSTYSRITSKRQGRGNRISGPPASLLRTPPDFDQFDYIGDYYASPIASPILGRQRSYRNPIGATANPGIGNSLWALTEQKYESTVNRFINSVEFGLKPVSWFDLTARAGYDFNTDERLEYFPLGDSQNNGNGQFTEAIYKEGEWSTDVIGRITKDFGQDFSVTYIAGFNINDRNYSYNGTTVSNFIIGNAPTTFTNATAGNRVPVNEKTRFRTARAYNTANFAAWNSLFLNASLAGEAGSGFGENSNKTFYYPSADVAWQFSQLGIFKDSRALSFGKLRASYGVVGIQPLPYKTRTTFVSADFNQGVLGDNLSGAQYGNGAFVQNSEQGNDQLKPERKTEYEIGADLRFFNNKLKLGVTYYQNTVKDLLIPVGVPASSGYVSRYSNAASLENKGIEADFGFDILRTDNIKWSVNANVSRVRNKVTSLSGSSFIAVTSSVLNPVAVVGQPVGVLWAGKYQRTADGKLELDENQFPKLDVDLGVIGDPNPDFTGGFGSTFSFKKFSLDVLFETSQGGDFYEGTRGTTYNFGTHEDVGHDVTLTQDVKNYAGKVFQAGTTVRGNLKDFGGGTVLLDQPYYTSIGGGFSDLKEHLIGDGSWTRLRQLSLNYRIDTPGFKKFSRLQSIDVSATGRNLLLWSKIKGIDPDTNLSGSLLSRGQDYYNSPNTRSYVFSVKITY